MALNIFISITITCKSSTSLTCDPSVSVAADLKLLLLVPPQVQQQPGGALPTGVPPAQDVGQGVGVVAQLQQGGEDVGV